MVFDPEQVLRGGEVPTPDELRQEQIYLGMVKKHKERWMASRGLVEALDSEQSAELEANLAENDIHIREHAEDRFRLEKQHQIDPLTGLYLRDAFQELFVLGVRRDLEKDKMALLFTIDIDKFKTINDGLSYKEGDDVLKQIGVAITSSIREGDVGCRRSGDELYLLLNNVDPSADTALLFTHITDAISKIRLSDGRGVSVSVGCVKIKPDNGSFYNKVIMNSEDAASTAKGLGRNRLTVYDGLMHSTYVFKDGKYELDKEGNIEDLDVDPEQVKHDVESGLERTRGEIEAYYKDQLPVLLKSAYNCDSFEDMRIKDIVDMLYNVRVSKRKKKK